MPPIVRLSWILAGMLALAPPTTLPAQAQTSPTPTAAELAKKREETRRAQESRNAQAKIIRKKLDTLRGLIKEVNSDLGLRTAGSETFERKRTLENQLRDYITELSLTDQALAEAERLSLEVESLRKSTAAGPRDTRRLQLVNFLDARRKEYVLFATR